MVLTRAAAARQRLAVEDSVDDIGPAAMEEQPSQLICDHNRSAGEYDDVPVLIDDDNRGDDDSNVSVEADWGCCYAGGGVGLCAMAPVGCDGEGMAEEQPGNCDADSGVQLGAAEEEKAGVHKPRRGVTVIYSNIRGMRKAAGELCAAVQEHNPAFVVLTETHLQGDAVGAEMLPGGYKVVARYDHTKHGGGVLILALDSLLVDTVDCK